MSERAPRTFAQTDLAIVREIERIATKVQETNISDLEIALLMAHMPNLLREYRMAREAAIDAPLPAAVPAPTNVMALPPRLHLVGAEEVCP